MTTEKGLRNMAAKKKTKKKLAKKTVKRAPAKKYKCGSCGKRGHNARTCEF